MADRSLQSSIWAPGNRSNFENRQDSRLDSVQFGTDWSCTSCGFSNFPWRKECFRCSISKSRSSQSPFSTNGHFTGSPSSRKIQSEVKPPVIQSLPAVGQQPEFKPSKNGLATSRWAPRRHAPGETEVWIRTMQFKKPSRPPSPTKTNSNIPIQSPDIGLPYQVQHYILALMQRILEEACYDFASRWVPQLLHEKRWDCSEAVELSTWRTFLPATLPPSALKPLSNYTLESALADAVRIRNSAVHRHLCDNHEMRQMALQAQDLMSMFSDTTRQNKFYQLWSELNAWNPNDDPSGARSRLERALQEISERPMDDMDWTPNAVSLEQVPAGLENIQASVGHYGDAMELD